MGRASRGSTRTHARMQYETRNLNIYDTSLPIQFPQHIYVEPRSSEELGKMMEACGFTEDTTMNNRW